MKTLTLHGVTLTIPGWARRLGVRGDLIRKRLAHGWSVKRTLTEPVGAFFNGSTKRAA